MLNKILKEYKRFIKKEFRKIVDSSSWHKKNELLEEIFEFDIIAECKEYKVVWKKYLDENAALLNIKLDNLKKDLGTEELRQYFLVLMKLVYFIQEKQIFLLSQKFNIKIIKLMEFCLLME